MEHKINEVVVYNHKGKTIQLKVTPTIDNTCKDCFFYGHYDICSDVRNIIGICDKIDRTDNTPVIFKQINNKIMKKIIDIYVIIIERKQYRSLCEVYTSFEKANKRFEELFKYFKELNKVQPKECITKSISSKIKISAIGNTTLYLCKEDTEIEISEEIEEPISDKSKFNPFFCANNCFNESIKHTPFGILKDSTDKYYTILDISRDGISILSDNHSISTISFKFASTFLKYADGTPFGYTDLF